jgi:phospholipase/carboxylesterase
MLEDDAPYLGAALVAARTARAFLEWMETVAERLAPERSQALASDTEARFGEVIRSARAQLDRHPTPSALKSFAARFDAGFTEIERAHELFTGFPSAPPTERIARILGAMHHLARAQETFYLLRQPLTPFTGYWDSPGCTVEDCPASLGSDHAPPTGVIHVSRGGHHGGFSLYVPERYQPSSAWPAIVALHGGSGNGRDFLWTWVREARSRGYLLVAPTAAGDTWGEEDDRGLLEILTWTGRNYHLDSERILLTGLSDGATFGLLYGLAHPTVYRAVAPLCGILHPANEIIGNLQRAAGVPIYLVHGALDFLFPVQLARFARDTLSSAGAELVYRELAELSHTYPRSENTKILDWFEALPCR